MTSDKKVSSEIFVIYSYNQRVYKSRKSFATAIAGGYLSPNGLAIRYTISGPSNDREAENLAESLSGCRATEMLPLTMGDNTQWGEFQRRTQERVLEALEDMYGPEPAKIEL